MKKRMISMLLGVSLVMGLMTGCKNASEGEAKKEITVGSVALAEGQLVSELYSLALEDAGYKVNREEGIQMPEDALLADEIDVYPEYTGSAYTRLMGNDPIYDSDKMTEEVRKFYKEKHNVAVLEPSAINNSYGIVMMKDKAEEMGIKTFADLQKKAKEVVWADWGFLAMPTTGRTRIEELYGKFDFKEVLDIDMSVSYDTLKSGDADVIPVCTTDAQLTDENYLMLEPEKDVWCEYLLVPFIRQEILDNDAEVEEILNNVSSKLNNDVMIPMIHRVDIEHEDVHDVAAEFYKENIKTK